MSFYPQLGTRVVFFYHAFKICLNPNKLLFQELVFLSYVLQKYHIVTNSLKQLCASHNY
jgi:hypothetical protein